MNSSVWRDVRSRDGGRRRDCRTSWWKQDLEGVPWQQQQINGLLHGFQQLEELMQAEKITSPSQKIQPTDFAPTQTAPTGQPPPPALPNEYDGNCFKGQAFLTSCQTYIHLCPESFPGDHVKITWALSHMKSGWAAKWAEQIFIWEEKHKGYSKFLDWEEFRKEFWKDFCPAHADVTAINKLESTSYYQKSRSVDNYLDKFVDFIVEAGYMDPKTTVVKFQKGLDLQIQNTIATMAYGCPSNTSPEDWYEVAKNVNQNHAANEVFKSAYQAPGPIPTHLTATLICVASQSIFRPQPATATHSTPSNHVPTDIDRGWL